MEVSSMIETEHHSLGIIDVLMSYQNLCKYCGEQNVYLLESFTVGPLRDARASYIGFNPLFKLRIKGAILEIDGVDMLVDPVKSSLYALGLGTSSCLQLQMVNREQLWDVLRTIQMTITRMAGYSADLSRLGYFGYLGYDIAHSIENFPCLIQSDKNAYDAELTLYQGLVEIDIKGGSATLHIHQAKDKWKHLDYKELRDILQHEVKTPSAKSHSHQAVTFGTTSCCSYESGVQNALEHISAGDIYQVQLGHELIINSDTDPLGVYQRLRQRNPSPYMYMAPFDTFQLIGASPELYIRSENELLTMSPIAGTAKCSDNRTENERIVHQLRNDKKEIAEHVMLVDLCRNDLGRVCSPHELRVEDLLSVERYSQVYHLVSSVTAKKDKESDIYDVIKATFPAGTMTGAPKVRAMEIIESLETTRRGPYAGAIGMISFDNQVNLALCIRTTVHRKGEYRIRASAGIVADSTPGKEWNETLHKMAAVYWAITGEEIPYESIGY